MKLLAVILTLLPIAAWAQGTYINQLNTYTGAIGNIVLPGMQAGVSPVAGQTFGVTVGTGANQLAAGNDSRIVGAVQAANNGTDFANTATTLSNLGGLARANNLSDVANAAAALSNLGGLAKANNLSDVANASTALTNLGGLAAANNLSDLGNVATALSNLGLGAADSPTFAGMTLGGGSNNALTITPGSGSSNTTIGLSGTGNLFYDAGKFESKYFYTPGNTQTLSGSTVPTRTGNFGENITGSSTIVGNTSAANVSIGSSSYNAAIPNGTFNELLITTNTGSSFDGGLGGLMIQLNMSSATTLSNADDGIVAIGAKAVGSANVGGTSSGFGVSNFGIGSVFGSNPWCQLASGSTYYTQCVGEEVDASVDSGASVGSLAILQLVLTKDHAVQGTVRDVGLSISKQVGASVGLHNIIAIGSYASGWPGDPNAGYLLQVQSPAAVNTALAGGFDLNQLFVSGASGIEGGGFFWRSPGVQIVADGMQVGNGLLSSSGSGLSISAPYEQMSAAAANITVSSGGSGFSENDLACDIYGDCVRVHQVSGVVTAVNSIVSSGWQTAPPANPVAFTARTRAGPQFGTGLTLNLTWTAKNAIILANLPTSCAGQATGTIWSNANVLNVCP